MELLIIIILPYNYIVADNKHFSLAADEKDSAESNWRNVKPREICDFNGTRPRPAAYFVSTMERGALVASSAFFNGLRALSTCDRENWELIVRMTNGTCSDCRVSREVNAAWGAPRHEINGTDASVVASVDVR